MANFAEQLRTKLAFKTQTDVAKETGHCVNYIHHLAHGHKLPSLDRVPQWAEFFGLTETYVVKLILQGRLDKAGLKYRVTVRDKK